MHPSSHAALALLLLSAQPAAPQAPLPPLVTDAAAVVDGLIVDMRYFGANNFVGERIRLRASALPFVGAGGERAGRGRARSGGARTRPQSVRLLPAAARGRPIRALGAADRGRQAQTRILSRRGQARAVQQGLYFRSLRSLPRLDRRSHLGAARGRPRAGYGLAVRLLQPEIMAVGSERK